MIMNLKPAIIRRIILSSKKINVYTPSIKRYANRHFSSNCETEEFMSLLPSVINELTHMYGNNDENKRHFERALQHNLPFRKLYKEHIVPFTYRNLENTENLTINNIHLANILGWCVELYYSALAIVDDFLDDSENRDNQVCWYKVKDVGIKQALTDSKIIESALYFYLKKYFATHRSYTNLLKLFCEVNAKTALGVRIDLFYTLNIRDNNYIKYFNIKNYITVIKLKSCYALPILPVLSGMYLTNKYTFELPQYIEDTLFKIGYLVQIQNDAEDYFANSCGGTDIPEGKLTWFIVKALELATPRQLEVLINNYGKSELQSQKMVEDVYEEIQLFSLYQRHKTDTIRILKQHTHELSDEQFKNFLNAYLSKYIDFQTLEVYY